MVALARSMPVMKGVSVGSVVTLRPFKTQFYAFPHSSDYIIASKGAPRSWAFTAIPFQDQAPWPSR